MYFPNQPTEEIIIDSPRWEAVLSNGEKCYHDNSIPSSWQRLKEYCDSLNLKVTSLLIGFRDNTVMLPEHKSGYFFRMMDRQSVLSESVQLFFLAGYIEGDELVVKKYKVPEMILEETEGRVPSEYKESII